MCYKRENVEFLKSLEKRTITLNDYCYAYYRAKVLPLPKNQQEMIKKVAQKTVEILPKHPYNGRVNEFGNHMEKVLRAAIKDVLGVKARGLGTGYPDVHFKFKGKNYYPECKVTKDFEPDSFRFFYTSAPSETTKANKKIADGYHLLFHFQHDMRGRGKGSLTGKYKISDLEGFLYRNESIQQGNKKDLYLTHKNIIAQNDS